MNKQILKLFNADLEYSVHMDLTHINRNSLES